MSATQINPFSLICEPGTVIDQMEHSMALRRLHHKVWRPLDRPVLRALSVDLVAFDAEIDRRFAEGRVDDMPSDASAA